MSVPKASAPVGGRAFFSFNLDVFREIVFNLAVFSFSFRTPVPSLDLLGFCLNWGGGICRFSPLIC